MTNLIPPGLILIIGGILLPALPATIQRILALLAPILALGLAIQVPDGVSLEAAFLGYSLEIIEGDQLSRLFGIIFGIMALGGTIYALNSARTNELAFGFIYAGSAMGVAFAGDLITMFVFWEIMAIGSTMVVWNGGSDAARRAGMRYALVHFYGGVILMIGVIGQIAATGSIDFHAMETDTWYRWIMLFGFLQIHLNARR